MARISYGDDLGFRTVKLPIFRESLVRERMVVIRSHLVSLEGQAFDGNAQRRVARGIADAFDFADPQGFVIQQSLDDLTQLESVTPLATFSAAWRLATNLNRLRQGIAVPSCPAGMKPYWSHGVIKKITLPSSKSGNSRPKIAIRVFIQTGLVAGHFVTYQFSPKAAYPLFAQLTDAMKRVRFSTPLLLMGMKGAFEVSTDDSQVVISTISASKSQTAFNKRLTRSRFRQFSDCVHHLHIDCDVCPVGRNECVRSIRDQKTRMITTNGNS